jgi:hypothetical protein
MRVPMPLKTMPQFWPDGKHITDIECDQPIQHWLSGGNLSAALDAMAVGERLCFPYDAIHGQLSATVSYRNKGGRHFEIYRDPETPYQRLYALRTN